MAWQDHAGRLVPHYLLQNYKNGGTMPQRWVVINGKRDIKLQTGPLFA